MNQNYCTVCGRQIWFDKEKRTWIDEEGRTHCFDGDATESPHVPDEKNTS